MQKYNSKYKIDLKSKCYQFSLNLIKLIDSFPNQTSFRIIGNQLLRSGTSVGANLIEASAASSKRDFKRFHEISLKSANESKYWLSLLKDSRKIQTTHADPLLSEINQISNMIASGIMKMKGKK